MRRIHSSRACPGEEKGGRGPRQATRSRATDNEQRAGRGETLAPAFRSQPLRRRRPAGAVVGECRARKLRGTARNKGSGECWQTRQRYLPPRRASWLDTGESTGRANRVVDARAYGSAASYSRRNSAPGEGAPPGRRGGLSGSSGQRLHPGSRSRTLPVRGAARTPSWSLARGDGISRSLPPRSLAPTSGRGQGAGAARERPATAPPCPAVVEGGHPSPRSRPPGADTNAREGGDYAPCSPLPARLPG